MLFDPLVSSEAAHGSDSRVEVESTLPKHGVGRVWFSTTTGNQDFSVRDEFFCWVL